MICWRGLPGVLSSLLLLAACDESSSCRKACTRLATCAGADLDAGIVFRPTTTTDDPEAEGSTAGGYACSFSVECPRKESCLARCIEQTTCAGLSGKDAVAHAKLTACRTKCENIVEEASTGKVSKDGGVITKTCSPSCTGKSCGDDGCGGTCGICVWPATCSAGQCSCTPSCSGKQCGSDGCGGSCGTCVSGKTCSSGLCVSSCTPSCSGKLCGSDGCGGSCGTCASGKVCSNGLCISSCTPSCTGKECGSDGCGGSCGTCAYNETCTSGICKASCSPCCLNKECGSDGCGGSCGTCPTGYTCSSTYSCQKTGTTGCGTVSYEGCCSGTSLKYCDGGVVQTVSCASSPSCGWASSGGYYDCGTSGGSDPSGLHPKTCY